MYSRDNVASLNIVGARNHTTSGLHLLRHIRQTVLGIINLYLAPLCYCKLGMRLLNSTKMYLHVTEYGLLSCEEQAPLLSRWVPLV